MDLNPVTLIIILNINSLHLEIKKQKFSEWVKIKKKWKDPTICLKESFFTYIGTHKVKGIGCQKIYYANTEY